MDSSNAETAWDTWTKQTTAPDWAKTYDAFMTGWNGRDAEVEALRKDRDSWKHLWGRLDSTSEKHYENLIQDRMDAEAERDALREQLAAAEAALTKSEAVCDAAAAILSDPGKVGGIPHALVVALSVFATQVDTTLAARDREVAARALDDMADEGERFMFDATGEQMPSDMDAEGIPPRWHETRRLRERAAALRSGTEGA